MNIKLKEKALIDQAFRELHENIGIVTDLAEYPFEGEQGNDALVRLQKGNLILDYLVEAKPNVTKNILVNLKEQLKKTPRKLLLVTKYVNPKMAERIREAEIPFIDTAGNAYLNEPELFLFIKGNKPKTELAIGNKGQGKAFKAKGLRVTFALLCNPKIREAKYEDIATEAKVALGTVAGVMNDLKEQGYLLKVGAKHHRLINGNELLHKWVDAYLTQLRPALLIQRYRTPTNDTTWQNAENLEDVKGFIGGEVAAAKLTDFLKPETLTIYADEPLKPDFLLNHKLREDPNGNVEVIIKFWNFKFPFYKQDHLVHPILIYADLLALDDDRLMEVARKMLEEEHLEIV